MAKKQFHIADILSITTGILVSQELIGGVYKILNWMTGENIYTHQIPRASREAAPILLSKYPALADVQSDAESVNPDNHAHFIAKMEQRFGKMLAVPQMNLHQHERIDALSELVEKVHPNKILVARPTTTGGE